MRPLTFARALDDAINQEERQPRARLSTSERGIVISANSVYALNHEPTIPDVISNTRC